MEESLLTQNTEGERQEIRHPLHPDHPLALLDDISKELRWTRFRCRFCSGRFYSSPPVFRCKACEFYLHDVCAKSPQELPHPSHPTHPLKLQPVKRYKHRVMPHCVLCNAQVRSGKLVYACDNPNNMCFEVGLFVMHDYCALRKLPSKKHPLHQHPLVSIREYDCCKDCAACGTTMLNERYSNFTDLYRCLECNVRFHQGCVEVDAPTTSELQVTQQCKSKETHHRLHDCPLLEITISEGDIKCGLCKSFVNNPAYGCEDCGFFMHQQCVIAPKQLLHPLHECRLRLWGNGINQVCKICNLTIDSKDFYQCDGHCRFSLHVYCAALKATWHHQRDHEHPFVFIKEGHPSNCGNCPACGTEISSSSDNPTSYYLCWTCNISFHARCFNLPTVKQLDRHPCSLTLYFDPMPAIYEDKDYYCDLCNEKRDIHTYSYACKACDYISHTYCDLFDKPQEVRYEEEDRKCQRLLAGQEATLDDIQKRIKWLEEELHSMKLLEEELCTLKSKKSACEE